MGGRYRQRWQHDKIVRCHASVTAPGRAVGRCTSKNGLITWETQQTDYAAGTQPPPREPRGYPRGASSSWYVYSARVKYPMVRGVLE